MFPHFSQDNTHCFPATLLAAPLSITYSGARSGVSDLKSTSARSPQNTSVRAIAALTSKSPSQYAPPFCRVFLFWRLFNWFNLLLDQHFRSSLPTASFRIAPFLLWPFRVFSNAYISGLRLPFRPNFPLVGKCQNRCEWFRA